MPFLDDIRNEWKLAAKSIACEGANLAAEADLDNPHQQVESARLDENDKKRPGIMSSFVHGWYSARNSCMAQGGHGHQLGPNFGNFQNTGFDGPEMGA